MNETELTAQERLEQLCWDIAGAPPNVVAMANQDGYGWVQEKRDEARGIIVALDFEKRKAARGES